MPRLDGPEALKRGIGSPPLFGIVQGFLSASLYFALGVVVVERARLHVARAARRVAVLRAARALLHGGRVAAPGARRRDGDRPLRLQRAVELRRRLGDPARLPDPDRDHGVRDDGLRRACSGASFAHGVPELLARDRVIAYVAVWSTCAAPARGAGSARRSSWWPTSALQLLIVVLGLALLFEPEVLTDPSLGGSPAPRTAAVRVHARDRGVLRPRPRRRRWPARSRSRAAGCKRLFAARVPRRSMPYIGIALVASSTLPQTGDRW